MKQYTEEQVLHLLREFAKYTFKKTEEDVGDYIVSPTEDQYIAYAKEFLEKEGTKSKMLELESRMEDNDFKALGLINKARREKRLETFSKEWLEKITASPLVTAMIEGERKYTFYIIQYSPKEDLADQVVDYFPKANKVLIRKENRWVINGLNWLIKRLKLKD